MYHAVSGRDTALHPRHFAYLAYIRAGLYVAVTSGMLRLITTALVASVLLAGATASADMNAAAHITPAPDVNEDSVMSIGAETTMNEHDAVVAVPGKGKLVASANADVFCAGDETARTLIIDVNEAGNVLLDLCEDHLERREITIRFVSE